MIRGYIKLWRKIEDWRWYKDATMVGFFIHLLISANHRGSSYLGVTIPRGSLVCGRKALSDQTGLTEDQVRLRLRRLVTSQNITIKTTNKFSVVSIVNYETYQEKNPNNDPNKSPTNPQQTPTSKEWKNERMQEGTQPSVAFITSLKTKPAFKDIDVDTELSKMDGWLEVHPGRRKTRQFIINWLNRSLDDKKTIGDEHDVKRTGSAALNSALAEIRKRESSSVVTEGNK